MTLQQVQQQSKHQCAPALASLLISPFTSQPGSIPVAPTQPHGQPYCTGLDPPKTWACDYELASCSSKSGGSFSQALVSLYFVSRVPSYTRMCSRKAHLSSSHCQGPPVLCRDRTHNCGLGADQRTWFSGPHLAFSFAHILFCLGSSA